MSELQELRQRLLRAEERARQAEDRAAYLKFEIEKLRAAPAAASAGLAGEARFKAVKRAFARLYHPDQAQCGDLERVVRTQVFHEFWPEIERIERGG